MMPLECSSEEPWPKIAILGAGNMGTAFAHTLAVHGRDVSMWDHFPQVVEDITTSRVNTRFLPDVSLHANIEAHKSATECVAGASLIIFAVPSSFIRSTLESVLPALHPETVLLNVAKGFAAASHLPIISALMELTPAHCWVHLAGPCIANELARGQPASVVIASHSEQTAESVARWCSGPLLDCSVTTDLSGAMLGGILKNVYAILLGCLYELNGNRRNIAACAVTSSVAEMARISIAYGARSSTIYGLSGLGDLIGTGSSLDSHNFKFGQSLASGHVGALLPSELLPEGARAAATVCRMASDKQLSAPLAQWVQASIAGQTPSLEGILAALRAARSGEANDVE